MSASPHVHPSPLPRRRAVPVRSARRIGMAAVATALLAGAASEGAQAHTPEPGASAFGTQHHFGWESLPAMTGGIRQEHGVAALDGKVYVVAGIRQVNTDRVEVYDTATRSWSHAAPLPVAMNHPNVAAVGGALYVTGGMVGTSPWTAVGVTYRYDPGSDRWTELAPMPAGTERGASAVGVHGTRIYIAGGLRSLTPGPGGFQDTVDTHSAYDTATNTWEALPALPEARDHVGGGVVGGGFYVLGGRRGGVENVKDTTFAYDVAARRWTSRAPMPTARGGVAASVVGKKIYVIGGEGNPAPGARGVFAENEVFDPRRNTWKRLESMPNPLHGTGAATVGGTIHIPGGGPQTRLSASDVHETYTPKPGRGPR